MLPKLQLLFSLFLFAAFSNGSQPPVPGYPTCSTTCNFNICRKIGKVKPLPHGFRNILRASGEPMVGSICSRNSLLKDVTIREALVRVNDSEPFVPISTFGQAVVSPHFRKKFFSVTKQNGGGVTFTHESRGNQYDIINNLCVTVPLKSYTRRNPPHVFKPLRQQFTNDPNDCVSFRAVSPKLVFELTWNSHDDFDIFVTEPTNPPVEVSRFNVTSENGGRLLYDVGSDGAVRCGKPIFRNTRNRESIFYMKDSTAPSGRYKVEIQHQRNCYNGPTEFKLQVLVHGKPVMTEIGVSNGDLASIAGVYMIDVKV